MFLKWKNRILILLTLIWFVGMSVFCFVHTPQSYSSSERRPLAKKPSLSLAAIVNTKDHNYMQQFETYAVDQFPFRDSFLSWNAQINHFLFRKKVINGIYFYKDYAIKQDSSIHEDAIHWCVNRFDTIQKLYAQDNTCYLCIIPDRQYFTYQKAQVPALSYDLFYENYKADCTAIADFIDIRFLLQLDNYYKTDLHWRQESLPQTAEYLLNYMHAWNEQTEKDFSSLKTKTVDVNFYGVYKSQTSLPLTADNLSYLWAPYMQNLVVTDYDSGTPVSMPLYDMDKAQGRDGYEMFLSGSKSILTIENTACTNPKNLILFRDSFGSSIAPLLASGYQKITLVDIRYISPAMLQRFVDFENADVLFLYSTSVLNSTSFLK